MHLNLINWRSFRAKENLFMPEFEPNAEGLSITNALLLGQAALTAYQDADACGKWAAANGFNETFDFFCNVSLKTDTNGFVAQNAEMILVAFRGTDPLKPIDWFTDFDALQQHDDFPGARVHKGFDDALDAVWRSKGEEVLPQRLAARGDRKVWITGHSLGGALAELAAAKAAIVSGIPVQGVYTFGQPRVGDEGFARKVNEVLGSRIFRFINNHDIVPRVPLFSMGYRHFADELLFKGITLENHVLGVETLFAAVRLAALAVNLDLAREVLALGEALLTDNAAVVKRELGLLGNLDQLLAQGTANIGDHCMLNGYLPRLEGLITPRSSVQSAP
jgi:triacylglycerol lipase